LGKLIGTSGVVIYEREEITPLVEINNKMAISIRVLLDYFVGKVELDFTDGLWKE
jgi:hypothetical protein